MLKKTQCPGGVLQSAYLRYLPVGCRLQGGVVSSTFTTVLYLCVIGKIIAIFWAELEELPSYSFPSRGSRLLAFHMIVDRWFSRLV